MGRKGGKTGKGRIGRIGTMLALFGVLAGAQQNPNAPANFVSVNAPVVALTHARVIDGTGAAAREDQTIVIRDGTIVEVGDASRVAAPAGATVVAEGAAVAPAGAVGLPSGVPGVREDSVS